MKYISFVVPCYNSESYMEHCIDTLLIGKEDVEIIIVDDGSTDNTGKIADNYQKKYPTIVKAIHQKNGGHGEGINTGLKYATGKYFKVVDSDDWVDKKAYKTLLKRIRKIDSDLIIMNYVYTYIDGRKDQVINFKNVFKDNQESLWRDSKHFKVTQYLSLHSMMYKKSVLDKCKIKLPKHVFYEDNLFIYWPLPKTKTIYYMDLDFYRYFIGRPDQSVQISQTKKYSHHQVEVSRRICNLYDLSTIEDKKLRKIMQRECDLVVTIAVCFSRLKKDEEGEKQYKELWKSIKEGNPKLYKRLRYFSLAAAVSIPGRFGRMITIGGYNFAHNLVKFN
ncbi:MAG: glycosyltransferase [Bacilli bacterium]|nr:glycosyltransferase [Bacilli bacterium]